MKSIKGALIIILASTIFGAIWFLNHDDLNTETIELGSMRSATPRFPAIPVEVALQPYFRDLRTVHVVSGKDTLQFLLDTGGGHTLITPSVAERLGCNPFGRSVGHRMTGERVEFRWCKDVSLAMNGVQLPDSMVAVFDLATVLPRELPSLDGLLSLKSINGRVVTLDLARNRLIFESAQSADSNRAVAQSLRARLANGEDGSSLTLFLAAEVSSVPIWMLLDSGNLVGTILDPYIVRQLNDVELDTALETQQVSIPLQLVGAEVWEEETLVRELIYDGVFGTSFLKAHRLMFDFREQEPWVGILPLPR